MSSWELKQRDKSVDLCCSECGYVRLEYAYNYEVHQLDKQEVRKLIEESNLNYCEKCGAKMEGVK